MAGEPVERLRARLEQLGPFGRPLRAAVGALLAGPVGIPDLVSATGLPRREVEHLLQLMGDDVRTQHGRAVLAPGRRAEYEAELGPPAGVAVVPGPGFEGGPADPLPARDLVAGLVPGDPPPAEPAELVVAMRELVAAAPAAVRHLDHVGATPETAVRRARWLDATYDLSRAHLLCVGDHDLTGLATAMVNPAVRVTVADVDEQVLEFADRTARARGWDVRCRWGDFRFGLPASAAGVGDLAFTDPPYTPEGVELFLLRALQGLRDPGHGRVLVAYGYGDHQPGLGLKVQEAMQSLHVTFEAILPGFNRYAGAQAIGSRSDLYVCRPTPRTWRALPGRVRRADPRIYTHGDRSLESSTEAIGRAAVAALLEPLHDLLHAHALAAPEEAGGRLVLAGDRWAGVDALWPERPPVRPERVDRVDLGHLLAVRSGPGPTAPATGTGPTTGPTVPATGPAPTVVAADLVDDPGAWLLRVLIGADAVAVTALVPNAHPDIATGAGLAALRELVAPRYRLTVRRSTPDGRYAVVEAHAAAPADDPGDAVVAHLLAHPRTQLGPAWRDGLYATARRQGSRLARPAVRELVREQTPAADLLDVPLLEIPRHRLTEVLAAARTGTRAALGGT